MTIIVSDQFSYMNIRQACVGVRAKIDKNDIKLTLRRLMSYIYIWSTHS